MGHHPVEYRGPVPLREVTDTSYGIDALPKNTLLHLTRTPKAGFDEYAAIFEPPLRERDLKKLLWSATPLKQPGQTADVVVEDFKRAPSFKGLVVDPEINLEAERKLMLNVLKTDMFPDYDFLPTVFATYYDYDGTFNDLVTNGVYKPSVLKEISLNSDVPNLYFKLLKYLNIQPVFGDKIIKLPDGTSETVKVALTDRYKNRLVSRFYEERDPGAKLEDFLTGSARGKRRFSDQEVKQFIRGYGLKILGGYLTQQGNNTELILDSSSPISILSPVQSSVRLNTKDAWCDLSFAKGSGKYPSINSFLDGVFPKNVAIPTLRWAVSRDSKQWILSQFKTADVQNLPEGVRNALGPIIDLPDISSKFSSILGLTCLRLLQQPSETSEDKLPQYSNQPVTPAYVPLQTVSEMVNLSGNPILGVAEGMFERDVEDF